MLANGGIPIGLRLDLNAISHFLGGLPPHLRMVL